MLSLGPLAFAQPWLLLALAALPALWWLLRVTPPAPRRQLFPALNLLLGLKPPEETPARTPLWLLILRFAAAALIIVGLAQPLANPKGNLAGTGPLLLVVDDGWASARNWGDRETAIEDLMRRAGRENRPVAFIATAPDAQGHPPSFEGLMTPGEARDRLADLKPKPWPVDRAAALEAVTGASISGSAHAVWLSNGLDGPAAFDLARSLQQLGRLDVRTDPPDAIARVIGPPVSTPKGLEVPITRVAADAGDFATVTARADDGRLLGQAPVEFAEGENKAVARLELPSEIINRIARLEIEGETTAGATLLIDERWRRRPVGLVSGGPLDTAQPLLDELYFLGRALEPFAELRRGSIGQLLERELSVLAVPDQAILSDDDIERLSDWVEDGGLVLRFAGPRMARDGGDALLPVKLRLGGRVLGGAMTWGEPAHLAHFDEDSPFAGLNVPGEVTVTRQVLAEPSLDLPAKTWARLSDGTPLVTADRRGEGRVVLFHTTANTEWSDLPLSGLFVEMLRRTVEISQGVRSASVAERSLPPLQVLDGFGQLSRPAPTVLALDAGAEAGTVVGPRQPPGLYGTSAARVALNLPPQVASPKRLTTLPQGVGLETYAADEEGQLGPWLLAAALALLIADLVISLFQRGLISRPAPLPARVGSDTAGLVAAAVLGLGVMAIGIQSAGAQETVRQEGGDAFALSATLETRLAYVRTGVPAIDATSRRGLEGLSRVLTRRTSVEPGEPLGVDLNADTLAFFPLIYWPVTPQQRNLSSLATSKVNDYLDNGGTILFDLREETVGRGLFDRQSRNSQALSLLTRGINMPPLAPVPPEHVLTRTFYLMQEFPGRLAGGTLWVETGEQMSGDGVASVIVGSNDWAAAWAVDEAGRPTHAMVPGGERQREFAYRFGVNLVMYALTGNYKADQVHVPAILERLGQ